MSVYVFFLVNFSRPRNSFGDLTKVWNFLEIFCR